ncbi:hypothetical protein H5410_023028 [Solanum commersonii]|uniref:Uncharacterized protein n=1 Tax=Solanum commersonii TaxID=4109 RepID=A0A9J5ZFP9_SOLCO|nr:hypothetical protein H5410_023028 [Solanum commersonii]
MAQNITITNFDANTTIVQFNPVSHPVTNQVNWQPKIFPLESRSVHAYTWAQPFCPSQQFSPSPCSNAIAWKICSDALHVTNKPSSLASFHPLPDALVVHSPLPNSTPAGSKGVFITLGNSQNLSSPSFSPTVTPSSNNTQPPPSSRPLITYQHRSPTTKYLSVTTPFPYTTPNLPSRSFDDYPSQPTLSLNTYVPSPVATTSIHHIVTHSKIYSHKSKQFSIITDDDNALLNELLNKIPYEKEVQEVVFIMSNDSCTGPYGFNRCFYQTYWDIIKNDIVNFFSEYFKGKELTKYYTHTCLGLSVSTTTPTRSSQKSSPEA